VAAENLFWCTEWFIF